MAAANLEIGRGKANIPKVFPHLVLVEFPIGFLQWSLLKLLAILFFQFRMTEDKVKAMIKEQVIEMIQSLPEDVSLDRILEELFFKLVIDSSLRQLDEGKGIPHSEVIEEFLYAWKYLLVS